MRDVGVEIPRTVPRLSTTADVSRGGCISQGKKEGLSEIIELNPVKNDVAAAGCSEKYREGLMVAAGGKRAAISLKGYASWVVTVVTWTNERGWTASCDIRLSVRADHRSVQ